MERDKVKDIFERVKERYLKGIVPSPQPTAYILGGQPSSGKSSITKLHLPKRDTLIVNGDLYRKHHPEHSELAKDIERYSQETQIFSNVFTEGLITEAIANRYNIVVEGTMRRPEIVLQTAKMFRDAGYQVEAHTIAAPQEFSSINIFHRFHKETLEGKPGRLADINSHNQAVIGIPNTLNELYLHKAVDKIAIYSMFGKTTEAIYSLNSSNHWTGTTILPSEVVLASRLHQSKSPTQIKDFLERGILAMQSIADKPHLVEHLSSSTANLVKALKEQSSDAIINLRIQKLEDDIDRVSYSSDTLKKKGLDQLWSELKVYNERRQKQVGSSFQEASISQAVNMLLDNRKYKLNGDNLETKEGKLFVNGKSYIQSEEVSVSRGLKR